MRLLHSHPCRIFDTAEELRLILNIFSDNYFVNKG